MKQRTLVIGGAGFVGSNLVKALLDDGNDVTVLDSMERRGTELNLAWLKGLNRSSELDVVRGDIKDYSVVRATVNRVQPQLIYHLAAQVAVTTSVVNPRNDFEVNALGTFNVLEAARHCDSKPSLIFTSTNKVYGDLEDVTVVERDTRYEFEDLPHGVSEERGLDFHSPYGCSKGAADQYVRDYARIYDIPAVVFRMSCIYGPRQFGNEDQGWIAHFMISAVTGRPITIYGNGKQVRDILYVDDLIRAFRLAAEKMDSVSGEIFNIGGGPDNSIAVWAEFGKMLGELRGEPVDVSYDTWRPGDQPLYISDIQKAKNLLGWQPAVDKETGLQFLWKWIADHGEIFESLGTSAAPQLSSTTES